MSKRTVVAALVLVGALAALLVAWFLSGWADVRARQQLVREAPVATASQHAVELARDLRDELAGVVQRESVRKYYHYQNVFHDPQQSASVGVTPSPLAGGPDDPLVLGHFRIDEAGRVTTPTINDDVPSLSEPTHLAGNTAFRNDVARTFAGVLTPRPTEKALVVASKSPPARPPVQAPARQVQQQTQVIQIDNNSFTQNNAPNMVYQQQAANEPDTQQANRPARQQQANPPPQPNARITPSANPPVVRQAPAANPPPPPTGPRWSGADPAASNPDAALVTVVVSPFEWKTLPFRGGPSLVAVRGVQMPGRALAQGFVIDPTTLTSWLADRAGDSVAELRSDPSKAHAPADPSGDPEASPGVPGATQLAATEIAPGWHLTVAPNPKAIIAANTDATELARRFIIRFVVVGVIAAIAAMFVVFLVARAEALARERSQFAAAAAHELRTPLAGLQLYGDMLADGLGDPAKLRDYARRMSEEASRLGRVVSNVLGFSQLERGNLSVEPRVGPLGEALRDLADRARPALDRAGATLSLEVADVDAKFDRDALARIVANLLDNAEKYSRGADDRRIDLTTSEVDDGVEVAVADRGPGIDPRRRASLFQPFKRGVDADGPAGLGLGLALSQSLARAMNGDLAYRATADGGATFVLRLAKA